MYIRDFVIYFKGGKTYKTFAQSAKDAYRRAREKFPDMEIIGYETTPDRDDGAKS
ncbi:hypothetical protein [Bacteroides acidifaciens]|uniref:hypothetical protein n=1 Tax=Bacteroides acidifaciens TaxID=85831 RepID=UPI00263A88F3|nr:hypothetical protein [Bacteroides acidifaciens]